MVVDKGLFLIIVGLFTVVAAVVVISWVVVVVVVVVVVCCVVCSCLRCLFSFMISSNDLITMLLGLSFCFEQETILSVYNEDVYSHYRQQTSLDIVQQCLTPTLLIKPPRCNGQNLMSLKIRSPYFCARLIWHLFAGNILIKMRFHCPH